MSNFIGTVGTDGGTGLFGEVESREVAGQWEYVEACNFWECDFGQWGLFVDQLDTGRWCAKVVLGLDPDLSLPVRVRNDIASMPEAKRWAVMALHEVARAMLDVKVPNMYEAVATDEVHTLNGAPFDEYIR